MTPEVLLRQISEDRIEAILALIKAAEEMEPVETLQLPDWHAPGAPTHPDDLPLLPEGNPALSAQNVELREIGANAIEALEQYKSYCNDLEDLIEGSAGNDDTVTQMHTLARAARLAVL